MIKTDGIEPIDVLNQRHPGLIPEGHPDREKIASHINKLRTIDPTEARRLYDRFISGGGQYIKDKPVINTIVNKSEPIEPDSHYVKIQGSNKWHKVLDVKDTGISASRPDGGNMYTVKCMHTGNVKKIHQSKIHDYAFGEDLGEDDMQKSISALAMEDGGYKGEKLDAQHHLRLHKEYKQMARQAIKSGEKEKALKYMQSSLTHLDKHYQLSQNTDMEKSEKNHPKGGLSRKEAKKLGIHAGIETHDEVKRKGGVSKLSEKTSGRRRSFCARHCGMKRKFPKAYKDRNSKGNKALRVWHCGSCSNWLKKSIGNNDSINFYEQDENLIVEFGNDVPHEIETLVVASLISKGFEENE
jgi:hypothetical protein